MKALIKKIVGAAIAFCAVATAFVGVIHTGVDAQASSLWTSRGQGSPAVEEGTDGYQKISGLTSWGTGMSTGPITLDGTKISFYSTNIPLTGGGHEMFGVSIGNTRMTYPVTADGTSRFTVSGWTRRIHNASENEYVHLVSFAETHATADYDGGTGVAYADAALTDNTLNEKTTSSLAFSADTTELGVALSFRYQATSSVWEVVAEVTHGTESVIGETKTTFYVPDEKILASGTGAQKQVYVAAIGFYDHSPSGTALNSYFKVEDITHDVVFDANGGTGEMDSQVIKENRSAPLKANEFVNGDKTFVGWATSPDGPVVYADGADFTMGMKDVRLYAKWINGAFTDTDVLGFKTSGEMLLEHTTSGVEFNVGIDDYELSALVSGEKYPVDGFAATFAIEKGFTVDGAQIIIALRDRQALWDRNNALPKNFNGVYVLLTRTGEKTLSYSVYVYKKTSTEGDYTFHQRGETVEHVPYDGVISFETKCSTDGIFMEISVNGSAFSHNLLVNEVNNIFGATEESAQAYMLMQTLSNGEEVGGVLNGEHFPVKEEQIPSNPSDDDNGGDNSGDNNDGGNGNGNGGDNSGDNGEDKGDNNGENNQGGGKEEDEPTEETGGCGSMLGGIGILPLVLGLGATIKKRAKKDEQ